MFCKTSGYNLFKCLKCEIKGCASTYFVIFSGVLIAIINPNGSAANADIEAHLEVGWLEWHAGAILLDHKLSLEEGALWGSRVHHLGLSDHD